MRRKTGGHVRVVENLSMAVETCPAIPAGATAFETNFEIASDHRRVQTFG